MPKSASTVPPPFGKPTLPWQFEHLQTMIPQNVSETSMCLVSKMASWFTSWSLSRRYTFRISQPTVTALSFSPLLRWIREGPCDQREGHLRMSGSPWALIAGRCWGPAGCVLGNPKAAWENRRTIRLRYFDVFSMLGYVWSPEGKLNDIYFSICDYLWIMLERSR